MAPPSALMVALALLAVDATIELGFITSMVSYLHSGAPSGTFTVSAPAGSSNATYELAGKPLNMLVNQGHTSNGAAGTALVLVGIVGALALFARTHYLSRTSDGRGRLVGHFLYYTWLAVQVPALLLTIVAVGYVFSTTNAHEHQVIDQSVAAAAAPGPYPLDQWTPQNWYAAVLDQLRLVHASDPARIDTGLRSDLAWHLRIMRGWQYNLIALFVLQLAETVLAFVDFWRWRVDGKKHGKGANDASDGFARKGAIYQEAGDIEAVQYPRPPPRQVYGQRTYPQQHYPPQYNQQWSYQHEQPYPAQI